VRKTAALVLSAGLLASLVACSSPAEEDEAAAVDCTPLASGDVSDAVEVSGAFGEKPEVTITTPATVTETQRTVVIEGDGTVAEANFEVTVDYTMFNGTTGDEIDATPYDGSTDVVFPLDGSLIAGLNDTLECTPVGSRVVGVASPADGLNEQALATYGMTAEDSLVVVADVVDAAEAEPVEGTAELDPSDYLAKADGEDQDLPADFPAVEVSIADDEAGTPTITIPDTAAPTELEIGVLKKGDGAVVNSGDDVVVNYTGVDWATKETFDSSWDRGAIANFPTTGVVEGFKQALEGQTIGSQVVAVLPPEFAYGGTESELADSTLVFVVDILGVVEAE
jgi:peptidylprolyl isomerase